ncbi:hypothetical protein SLS58_004234 [Diplodia intermedia]|uniref:Uncharacterized protein n=1 Tax=Diplodia intermedia TaxID=856260 RepID=A0ABR3TUX6_9PEZI
MSHTNPANAKEGVELTDQVEPRRTGNGLPALLSNNLGLGGAVLNFLAFREPLPKERLQEQEEKEDKEEKPVADPEASTVGDTPEESGESADQPIDASPESDRTATATSAAPEMASEPEDDAASAVLARDISLAATEDQYPDDHVLYAEEWDELFRASPATFDYEDDEEKMSMTWDEEELERRQRQHQHETLTQAVDDNKKAVSELNGVLGTHNDMLAKLLGFEHKARGRVESVEEKIEQQRQALYDHFRSDHGVGRLRQQVKKSREDIELLEISCYVEKTKNADWTRFLEEHTSAAVKSVGRLDAKIEDVQEEMRDLLHRESEDASAIKRAEDLASVATQRWDAHDAKLNEQAKKVDQLHSMMSQETKESNARWKAQFDEHQRMKNDLDGLGILYKKLLSLQAASGRQIRDMDQTSRIDGAKTAQQASRTKALEGKVQALCGKLEQATGRIEQLERENEELKRVAVDVTGNKVKGMEKEVDAVKERIVFCWSHVTRMEMEGRLGQGSSTNERMERMERKIRRLEQDM